MRFAHLSDLHLGARPRKARVSRVISLVDHAIDVSRAAHIVLGGDLVDSAELGDAAPLIAHLKKRRFFSAALLSVIPGNHDIWPYPGDLAERAPEFGWRLSALAEWKDFLGHWREVTHAWNAQATYDRFHRAFAPTFEGAWRASADDPYPCIKEVGGVRLVLVDSTSNTGLLEAAMGELPARDRSAVRRGLREGSEMPAILCVHHVPERLEEFEANTRVRAFLKSVPTALRAPLHRWLARRGIRPARAFSWNFTSVPTVRRFIAEAGFSHVLCGHVHDLGEPAAHEFEVGGVPVHVMGRSGDELEGTLAYHLVEASRTVRVRTVRVPVSAL